MLNTLLIAAGLSSRMGEFKPLLLFQNEPIIISIIKKILPLSTKVFIVTGYKEKEIVSTIEENFSKSVINDKFVFVSNPDFEKGMFISLQKGLEKAKDCNWILYHFVDQPQIPESFYSDFTARIDDKFDWIQPAYNKRKGHPVLISKSLFNSILVADENSSLKELINTNDLNKKIWNCKYKEILFDIDTPEDYNAVVE